VDTLTQLASSTEPVQIQVRATANGSVYDPSGDPVAVAFVLQGGPEPSPSGSGWNPATWEVDPGNPPSYWASVLVGPLNGGIALAAGTYVAYVRVTDNPAVPVKAGCYLNVI
jgi:hypothetical protein